MGSFARRYRLYIMSFFSISLTDKVLRKVLKTRVFVAEKTFLTFKGTLVELRCYIYAFFIAYFLHKRGREMGIWVWRLGSFEVMKLIVEKYVKAMLVRS